MRTGTANSSYAPATLGHRRLLATHLHHVTTVEQRIDFIKFIPRQAEGLELGVRTGVFSRELLGTKHFAHLTGIDAWGDVSRGHENSEYITALKALRSFRENSTVIRMFFEPAAAAFEDESFDFIYCDGYAHTGGNNGKDFEQYWPKLKKGGLFAGHDYGGKYPLVKTYVDKFFADKKAKGEVAGELFITSAGDTVDNERSWYMRKIESQGTPTSAVDVIKVPLCYFLPWGSNFGDELGVHVFRHLVATRLPCVAKVLPYDIAREKGHKVGSMQRPSRCVMGLGSIVHAIKRRDRWQLWGTGANRFHGGVLFCPDKVAAVRGPRTLAQLRDKCGPAFSASSTPFGDPGILASETFFNEPFAKSVVNRHLDGDLPCIIPHHADPSEHFKAYQNITHWPNKSAKEMISILSRCTTVLSSSLHGIIVAESLGIPAWWLQVQGSPVEKTESDKYEDYYEGTGRVASCYIVKDLQNGLNKPVNRTLVMHVQKLLTDSKAGLLKAFDDMDMCVQYA